MIAYREYLTSVYVRGDLVRAPAELKLSALLATLDTVNVALLGDVTGDRDPGERVWPLVTRRLRGPDLSPFTADDVTAYLGRLRDGRKGSRRPDAATVHFAALIGHTLLRTIADDRDETTANVWPQYAPDTIIVPRRFGLRTRTSAA